MKHNTALGCFSLLLIGLWFPNNAEALIRRCFSCRSRGDLGTCKDNFPSNVTLAEQLRGVETVPCASGWCGKILEGGSSFKDDEYGIATQRLCMRLGPSDNEERCAYTLWNHKKVYMCFCVGDLCNSTSPLSSSIILSVLLSSISIYLFT